MRHVFALLLCLAAGSCLPVFAPQGLQAATCVWKVTSTSGEVLYLAGSQHRLRRKDFPIPAAYERAFSLSERLAFEESPDYSKQAMTRLEKAGLYAQGDELARHLRP